MNRFTLLSTIVLEKRFSVFFTMQTDHNNTLGIIFSHLGQNVEVGGRAGLLKCMEKVEKFSCVMMMLELGITVPW